MSVDDILRKIPSQGGGIEIRFAHTKLSELSIAERQNLAKRIAEDAPPPPAEAPAPPPKKD